MWILENAPTYGVLAGNQIGALLAINALNTGLFFDAVLLPATQEQWRFLLERWKMMRIDPWHWERLALLKGSQLHVQKMP